MVEVFSTLKQEFDPSSRSSRIVVDFEIPEAENDPTVGFQSLVDLTVAGPVAFYLPVPEVSALPGTELARMPVPESAIDEYGTAESAEGEIRAAGEVASVAPPATHSLRPKRLP